MKINSLILALLLLPIGIAGTFSDIVPALQYEHRILTKPAQSIHILIADPHIVKIGIGIADNKCASAKTTLGIAKQTNAIAAINAGFFDFCCKYKIQDFMTKVLDCFGYDRYKAYPLWTLNRDSHYYSVSPIYTGAIGWNNADQQPIFGALKTSVQLQIHGSDYAINGLNKPNTRGLALYSSGYDIQTPYSRALVAEIVIQGDKIIEIISASHGKTTIPENGYVYVLPGKQRKLANQITVGDAANVSIANVQKLDLASQVEDEVWDSRENILASTPLLIQNNTIVEYLKEGKSAFYIKSHPRSAIGVLENGNWVFVVVDGRQKHAKGFTILELAQFMKDIGCTGALNFDGGGSSTMVIQDKVVNIPSGREYGLTRKERPVSNAIIISSKPV